MFSRARERIRVAWRKDKKKEVPECPYTRLEKSKLIRLERKREKKYLSY